MISCLTFERESQWGIGVVGLSFGCECTAWERWWRKENEEKMSLEWGEGGVFWVFILNQRGVGRKVVVSLIRYGGCTISNTLLKIYKSVIV